MNPTAITRVLDLAKAELSALERTRREQDQELRQACAAERAARDALEETRRAITALTQMIGTLEPKPR